jgi:hypothetical protein
VKIRGWELDKITSIFHKSQIKYIVLNIDKYYSTQYIILDQQVVLLGQIFLNKSNILSGLEKYEAVLIDYASTCGC